MKLKRFGGRSSVGGRPGPADRFCQKAYVNACRSYRLLIRQLATPTSHSHVTSCDVTRHQIEAVTSSSNCRHHHHHHHHQQQQQQRGVKVDRRRARLVLGLVTVSGFNSRSRYVTNHPGQLSLAIPPWVCVMGTGQRAVMLCGWE